MLDLILSIQRDEFGMAITAQDQPDLNDIPAFYQSGTGDFWVALADDRLVGTIALKDIRDRQCALRKMFVAASHRGRAIGVAQALLDGLSSHARGRGIDRLWLGANDRLLAAHRFYERNGFDTVQPDDLPATFPRMAVDSIFYTLATR